jgi:hypothetical protein
VEICPQTLPTHIDFLQKKSYPLPIQMCMDDFKDVDDEGPPHETREETKHEIVVPELDCSPDTTKLLSMCIKNMDEAIAATK